MTVDGTSARGRIRRVCVAAPTFRRPTQLAALLEKLALQSFDPSKYSVRFVIIDNDNVPTAKPIVDQAKRSFKYPLHVVHVPEPGLSSVRNFALKYASESDDLLAMVDDDHVPEREWLSELLRLWSLTNADAVVGPAPAVFPPDGPEWVKNGRFFDSRTLADGTEVNDGSTNNCLLTLSAIRKMQLTFDYAFNFSGGEDQVFFREMAAKGGRIVWAARAVAPAAIPRSRMNIWYLTAREFRIGNTLALCDLRLRSSALFASIRLIKAFGLIGLGAGSLMLQTISRGRSGAAEAVCSVCRGAGMIAGVLGYRFPAYARPSREVG